MSGVTGFENAPFTLSGRRIKASFHCHTLRSDGGLSPGETVKRYLDAGIECLGITDHRTVTRAAAPPGADILLIDSTENGGNPDIIGVGVAEPAPKELPLAERAAMLAEQGGFTIAAHPTYCAVLPQEYAECNDLMAMEIYNAYCDAAYTNGYATELWDMVLGMGKRIWGAASDDAHLNPAKRYYSDAGLGWVEVWVERLDEDPVMNALKSGAFFSTQGPVFDRIAVEENAIRIRCSPVRQVRWRTFGKEGYVDYAPDGSALTGSVLPDWFRPDKYVRIELVDCEGKRAWSNPFFTSPVQ